MKKITLKQKITLEVIEWFIKENGYPPTVREIASILGQSMHPVQEKLYYLEEKGYISTQLGKARTIKVLRSVESRDDCEGLYQDCTKEEKND